MVDSMSHRRSGMSLTEFLVAVTIMSLVAVAIGTASLTSARLDSVAQGTSDTVQHARVVQDFFRRTVSQAHGSLAFPGLLVLTRSTAMGTFPDTLVVWSPEGNPSDPEGLPRFSELVVFCGHPDRPNELIVVTDRTDNRLVPPKEDTASWRTEIDAFVRQNSDSGIVLTSRVHVFQMGIGSFMADAGISSTTTMRQPSLRFWVEQRPSAAEFDDYGVGRAAWNELRWPLDLYNSETGIVRVRCNVEFQLDVPDSPSGQILPFFDGASTSFAVARPVPTATSSSGTMSGSSMTSSGALMN